MEKSGSAPRNRTLTLSDEEKTLYARRLVFPGDGAPPGLAPPGLAPPSLALSDILNRTLCCDLFAVLDRLPRSFADLLFIDPPYNLDKDFRGFRFTKKSDEAYLDYLRSFFPGLMKTLKPTGSVYICGDWKSASCLYQVMMEQTVVRNRITWQREKGRGAASNWKNVCEDIWFGTKSDDYYFDLEAVKQRRRVLAPYRENGRPKDWVETGDGKFRLTCPGNFWDDISVPYWSMPENTGHPTQKPEKLLAKLILASCPENGVVLDPFLGSGTASVAAKKLRRQYVGIEINEEFCCLAEKRLSLAEADSSIQGYSGGVFWERNSRPSSLSGLGLFDGDFGG